MTMAVMGVVAVAAAPSVLRSTERSRSEQALSFITAEVSAARQQAMRHRVPAQVQFNAVTPSLDVWIDLNRNAAIDGGEQEIFALAPHAEVTWTLPANVGRFNAKGQFTADSGYWRVAARPAGSTNRYLYVFPSGQYLETGEFH